MAKQKSVHAGAKYNEDTFEVLEDVRVQVVIPSDRGLSQRRRFSLMIKEPESPPEIVMSGRMHRPLRGCRSVSLSTVADIPWYLFEAQCGAWAT